MEYWFQISSNKDGIGPYNPYKKGKRAPILIEIAHRCEYLGTRELAYKPAPGKPALAKTIKHSGGAYV
jgi:hypothetical protein